MFGSEKKRSKSDVEEIAENLLATHKGDCLTAIEELNRNKSMACSNNSGEDSLDRQEREDKIKITILWMAVFKEHNMDYYGCSNCVQYIHSFADWYEKKVDLHIAVGKRVGESIRWIRDHTLDANTIKRWP